MDDGVEDVDDDALPEKVPCTFKLELRGAAARSSVAHVSLVMVCGTQSELPNFELVRERCLQDFEIDEKLEEMVKEDTDSWIYASTVMQLWKVHEFYDPRLPGFGARMSLVCNDESWQDSIKGYPWTTRKWVGYVGEVLRAKVKHKDLSMQLSGAAGLWELAADRQNHAHLSLATLCDILSTITAIPKDYDPTVAVFSQMHRKVEGKAESSKALRVREDLHGAAGELRACGIRAIWCVSVTKSLRHGLLDLGALELCLKLVKAVLRLKTGEPQYMLMEGLAGATSMLLCDQGGRERAVPSEGSVIMHIDRLRSSFFGFSLRQLWDVLGGACYSRHSKPTVALCFARTLCNLLSADITYRVKFIANGGLTHLILLLGTENEMLALAGMILSLLMKDSAGCEGIIRSGQLPELTTLSLSQLRRAMDNLDTLQSRPALHLQGPEVPFPHLGAELFDLLSACIYSCCYCASLSVLLGLVSDIGQYIHLLVDTVDSALGCSHEDQTPRMLASPLIASKEEVRVRMVAALAALSWSHDLSATLLQAGVRSVVEGLVAPWRPQAVRLKALGLLLGLASHPEGKVDGRGGFREELIQGGCIPLLLRQAGSAQADHPKRPQRLQTEAVAAGLMLLSADAWGHLQSKNYSGAALCSLALHPENGATLWDLGAVALHPFSLVALLRTLLDQLNSTARIGKEKKLLTMRVLEWVTATCALVIYRVTADMWREREVEEEEEKPVTPPEPARAEEGQDGSEARRDEVGDSAETAEEGENDEEQPAKVEKPQEPAVIISPAAILVDALLEVARLRWRHCQALHTSHMLAMSILQWMTAAMPELIQRLKPMHEDASLLTMALDEEVPSQTRHAAFALHMSISSTFGYTTEGDQTKDGPTASMVAVSLMKSSDPALQEAGVQSCGHMAYSNMVQQQKLVEDEAVEALVRLLEASHESDPTFGSLILHTMLNLSTFPEAQLQLAKFALKLLLAINQEEKSGRDQQKYSSAVLNNIHRHPKNGTRFYRAEIREKMKRNAAMMHAAQSAPCLPVIHSAPAGLQQGPSSQHSSPVSSSLPNIPSASDMPKARRARSQSRSPPPATTLNPKQKPKAAKAPRGKPTPAATAKPKGGDPEEIPGTTKPDGGDPEETLPPTKPEGGDPAKVPRKPRRRNAKVALPSKSKGSENPPSQPAMQPVPEEPSTPSCGDEGVASAQAVEEKEEETVKQRFMKWSKDTFIAPCQGHLHSNVHRDSKLAKRRRRTAQKVDQMLEDSSSALPDVWKGSGQDSAVKSVTLLELRKELMKPQQTIWKAVVGQDEQGIQVEDDEGAEELMDPERMWQPQLRAADVTRVPPDPEEAALAFLEPKEAVRIELQLKNSRRRNKVHFNDHGVGVIPDNKVLAMWEAHEGSKVCEDLFPKYDLPDGRQVHFHQPKKQLVDEQHMGPVAAAAPLFSTEAMSQGGLPSVDELMRQTCAMPPATLPDPVKQRPLAPPKPPKAILFNRPTMVPIFVTGQEVEGGKKLRVQRKPASQRPPTPKPPIDWFKHIFKKHKSVFAPRRRKADSKDYYDTQACWSDSFEIEWAMLATKPGLVKLMGSPDDVSHAKQVTFQFFMILHNIFYEYCSLDLESPWNLGLNCFTKFAKDAKIIDETSANCKAADLDQYFIAVNVVPLKNSKANLNNPARSLVMYEWLDMLVRCGIAKYGSKDSQPDTAPLSPSKAYERLLHEIFKVEGAPLECSHAVAVAPDDFRIAELYKEEVDQFFMSNLPLLKALYNHTKGLSRSTRLTVPDYMSLMQSLHLIVDGDNGMLVAREVLLCFMKSRMLIVNPREQDFKGKSLDFVDFLECLARLADCLSPPTLDDLRGSGVESVLEYYKMTIFSRTKPLPRRSSYGMWSPNTRPLVEKIQKLMDLIEFHLMKKHGVSDHRKLVKKLVHLTTFTSGNV
ncbi:hypothetical protein CYMTET_49085 [Cymbomonas tetramitiformis]|uniref:Uncharacterized protein n=1 Tax=Cymbomonas tetramitiformis TaxID=36881 RepID=A0AAE0BQX0_9CHLO|nr:hypothetical protein CYMTET_49085 [Cymbomonas tetramitiformis]